MQAISCTWSFVITTELSNTNHLQIVSVATNDTIDKSRLYHHCIKNNQCKAQLKTASRALFIKWQM